MNPYEFIPRTRGTYRLTLSLPTERYTYSLKIPVIYSAYQFYVGDEQRLQIGNPQDGAYRDVLQEQVISFRSGGYVQLLIAYSGDSDSYCGMFYPPTLGRSLSIHRLGEYEQIFLSSSVTLLCLAALLCLPRRGAAAVSAHPVCPGPCGGRPPLLLLERRQAAGRGL